MASRIAVPSHVERNLMYAKWTFHSSNQHFTNLIVLFLIFMCVCLTNLEENLLFHIAYDERIKLAIVCR